MDTAFVWRYRLVHYLFSEILITFKTLITLLDYTSLHYGVYIVLDIQNELEKKKKIFHTELKKNASINSAGMINENPVLMNFPHGNP